MSESLSESPKVQKLIESFGQTWDKAISQDSQFITDLPVDHFFPTVLTTVKARVELGQANPSSPIGLTQDEARTVIKESLLFLRALGDDVGEDQWERMQVFWRTRAGRYSDSFGAREIADQLSEKGQLWDPFYELEITDKNMFRIENVWRSLRSCFSRKRS